MNKCTTYSLKADFSATGVFFDGELDVMIIALSHDQRPENTSLLDQLLFPSACSGRLPIQSPMETTTGYATQDGADVVPGQAVEHGAHHVQAEAVVARDLHPVGDERQTRVQTVVKL